MPWRFILVLAGLSMACSPGNETGLKTPEDIRTQMREALLDNITPFWYPRCLDRERGGYHLYFDERGDPGPPGEKMIVTQARMVWFFSRLAREGYEKPGQFTRDDLLAAARHGFEFLRRKMWDFENGGFYWAVDAAGNEVRAPNKHLYGQSFALYALSEYYLASRDEEAMELAVELFDVLEAKAHDARYKGYQEYFAVDWSEPKPTDHNYMKAPHFDAKLMNTHLHLLEAMTAYYRASRRPEARQRLIELIGIETEQVVRKDPVACTDKYERDWTPILENGYDRVSYGHDVENVWLVADACEAAGLDVRRYVPLFEKLWTYSRTHGFDEEQGGFFSSGPLGRSAENLDKVWWVQAEALVSALYMYKLTGDAAYREAFDKTWRFVRERQIDWTHGEWHRIIGPDGRPRGAKGGIWKCAYHNGRAMVECIRLLEELGL